MSKLLPAHAAIAAELEQAGFENGPAQENSRQRLECAGVPSSVSQPALFPRACDCHSLSGQAHRTDCPVAHTPIEIRKSKIENLPLLGVTAVIRDAHGRILLGRKNRACSPDLVGKWVTPGGRVNHGETLEAAIRREVREETALHVHPSGIHLPQELISLSASGGEGQGEVVSHHVSLSACGGEGQGEVVSPQVSLSASGGEGQGEVVSHHFVFVVFECRLMPGYTPEDARAGDDLSELAWVRPSDLWVRPSDLALYDLSPLTLRILNSLRFHLNLSTHF